MIKLFKTILLSVFIAQSLTAFGEFSGKQRSINNTGETLPSGSGEIGLASFSYGMTESLMLTVPTLPLVFGSIAAQINYQIKLGSNLRLTPYAGASLPEYNGEREVEPNFGGFFGINAGSRSQHSFAFGLDARIGRSVSFDFDKDEIGEKSDVEITITEKKTRSTYILAYDYYTSGGNLFYVGSLGGLPYYGFTWAWENFHVGILGSPMTVFLPIVPYFYVRF
jgi:hypothetical protein